MKARNADVTLIPVEGGTRFNIWPIFSNFSVVLVLIVDFTDYVTYFAIKVMNQLKSGFVHTVFFWLKTNLKIVKLLCTRD
jgi:hypothetical protein